MCLLAESAAVTGFECLFWQTAVLPSLLLCVLLLNLLAVHSTGPYWPTFNPAHIQTLDIRFEGQYV